MFINIKDSLEYRAELLEWENLYFRLKTLLEKKEGEPWEMEKENLELWWERTQKRLMQLYDQPEG